MGQKQSTTASLPSVYKSGIGQKLPYEEHDSCVYLDYNATTPIYPEVTEAMIPYIGRHFGNPSSGHAFGRPCAATISTARGQLAEMINSDPEEIVFTSCGSESDNWAIVGPLAAARERLGAGVVPHVVTSNIEHPAIIEHLKAESSEGRLTFTEVPVNDQGLLDPSDVKAAMTPATYLVTVMHSNNEIGTLQPIKAIADVAHAGGALMHTDAAQSCGKVPVRTDLTGADLITLVGHKFGAPKGVAALYVKKGTSLTRLFNGGGQERGLRAGTENVALIAALGRAAQIVNEEGGEVMAHMGEMRDLLQSKITARLEGTEVKINGPEDPSLKLPNTLSISIKGLQAAQLLNQLGDRMAASAGAACHSAGGPSVSSVLKAIQLPVDFAVGTLRLSTGRHTTPQDIETAAKLITDFVKNTAKA
eukprot:CAMPEP_0197858296 /NCGR_PEP_ID=MMETSP1438-20131217/32006_1 /TAXON_ID=1461541 /ORGANISM="Pterosperma sp., Strain CCMP1384" /LENGTH=418 /DNA_ID=CAMNT_0043474411 /DNA_START=276 /DNA_END=1532 /DNA_ORIENTATION=-